MGTVEIRWQIKAAGRDAGHVETVELSDFVSALIKQGRVKVLSETPDAPPSFPTDLPAYVAAEEAASVTEEVVELPAEESEQGIANLLAETFNSPKPRPRRMSE